MQIHSGPHAASDDPSPLTTHDLGHCILLARSSSTWKGFVLTAIGLQGAMTSLPENGGAEMDSIILSNDLLTQFQRTLAETSPGQMQADLQTILTASMSMAPSVEALDQPHD